MTTYPTPTQRARPILAAAVAAAAVLATAAPARSDATLRWKFRAGEVIRYQTVQTTTTMIQDLDGKPMQQSVSLTTDLTWTVKEVDAAGRATVAETIDRMRTSATSPYVGKMSDDSKDSDGKTPIGTLFKVLIGAEFRFGIGPRGEVGDIKLPDRLVQALAAPDAPPGGPGLAADSPGAIKAMLTQFGLTEAGMRNMLDGMTLVLPDGPVAPGAAWDRKIPAPIGPDGSTRTIEQRFVYQGAGPDAAGAEAVDLSTKFEPIKPDPNLPVTIESESADGRYLFDNAAGRIRSSTITQKIRAKVQVGDKELPQSIETVTTMTLGGEKAP